MATKKRSSDRSKTLDIQQIRREQLELIRTVIDRHEQHLKEATGHQKKQLSLLESVSQGLYEELDKLSKKAPAEQVTNLVLEEMNEVIKDTKELIENDRYIQRLNPFVAAGDNPEHRDAVVVMKQLSQGLKRFKLQLTPLINQLKEQIGTAKGIETALRLCLSGHLPVTKEDLEDYDRAVPSKWLTTTSGVEWELDGKKIIFDFDKLDRVDLVTFFELSDE